MRQPSVSASVDGAVGTGAASAAAWLARRPNSSSGSQCGCGRSLIALAAVLVQPPDVGGEVADGCRQRGQVVPVHRADHGGQLQPDARFPGDQPGRLDHLAEIRLLPPHRAVDVCRRSLDRDAGHGKVGQAESLIQAPAQELAVGVEHDGLAAPPQRGRVLADPADQQRFAAAQRHHARGGGRERPKDAGTALDRVLARHRPVAEVAGEVAVTGHPPVDRRDLGLRPSRKQRPHCLSQGSASVQRASFPDLKSAHQRPRRGLRWAKHVFIKFYD